MRLGETVHYVRSDGAEGAHGTCLAALVVGLHPHDVVDLAIVEPRTESVRWGLRENVPHADSHRFGSYHRA
jgi:hypothetical protein